VCSQARHLVLLVQKAQHKKHHIGVTSANRCQARSSPIGDDPGCIKGFVTGRKLKFFLERKQILIYLV